MSQMVTTGPYYEPDDYSSYTHAAFIYNLFQYFSSIYVFLFQRGLFIYVSKPKYTSHFLFFLCPNYPP